MGRRQGSEALAAEILDVGAGQADVVELGGAQRAQCDDRAPGVVPGPQRGDHARQGGDDAVDGDCADRSDFRLVMRDGKIYKNML